MWASWLCMFCLWATSTTGQSQTTSFAIPPSTPQQLRGVTIECFNMLDTRGGAIISSLEEPYKFESWHVLRHNRVVTAQRQQLAYCEYHGFFEPTRDRQWNKPYDIRHALFQLNFTFVVWLDADAFFAYPHRSLEHQMGRSDCGLSLDLGGTFNSMHMINSGIGLLRRTERVRSFLDTIVGPGFDATFGKPGYPDYFHEQNAFIWYVKNNRDMFVASTSPTSDSFCYVFPYGELQTFPRLDTDVAMSPNATARHYAGLAVPNGFHGKIQHTARGLANWRQQFPAPANLT
jgi:hypothetical protein